MKPAAVIAIAIVFAAGGFFGGMKYAQNTNTQARSNFRQAMQNGAGGQQRGANRMGGRPVTGEVIKLDDKTMTVKMADGTSRIVILSSTTTYSKTSEVAATDIAVGGTVGVFGTDNADGSVTAQNVQLNPAFRMGQATGSSNRR